VLIEEAEVSEVAEQVGEEVYNNSVYNIFDQLVVEPRQLAAGSIAVEEAGKEEEEGLDEIPAKDLEEYFADVVPL
jgi:hypothetical protein